MLIEDPDAFKSWLTTVLEPLCDADPGALAKYVFALVKKDKSNEALRESMVDQLEVFLQDETKPFVNLLFKTLETQEYNLPPIPNANPPNPNILSAKLPPLKPLTEIKEIIPVSELPTLTTESVNGSVPVVSTTTAPLKKEVIEIKRDIIKPERKQETDKEDLKPRRRSRHRSASRNRSRSRSWDRSRRSRSREKSRERDRGGDRLERDKRERVRTWRNKSPPRRYDRRRSRSPASPGRIRSRSRSPRHNYRGRYRNRSPPRSNTRSRSRSADRKDRGKDSGAATPTQDSNHGDTDMRLTSTTQSIQSVVAAADSRTPGSGPPAIKRRCRDFDEKGYCMRGEMCPFDHGVDPVVLEDTALSRVLTFGPNGAPVTGTEPAAPGAPLLPAPMIQNPPLMHHMPPRQVHPEYNPQAPAMWHRPGFRGPRPLMGPRLGQIGPYGPNMQRELISVPVLDSQGGGDGPYPGIIGRPQVNFHKLGGMGRGNYMMPDDLNDGMMKKKPSFDFNRLGPRNKNPVNCSLELKKVPHGLNNIMHLNNHFSKFGKIINIQVNYEGDPEAAIVTFSSHAEANAAYRSTEAVLNNRFIKVFWHSSASEGKQENVPPRSVKERLGQMPPVVAPNANKVLNLVQPKATTGGGAAMLDAEGQEGAGAPGDKSPQKPKNAGVGGVEKAQAAAAAIKKGQELLAAKEKLKKNQEEKQKEVMKITQDLRKRKQDLLEKQLASQKLLIEKLEKTAAGQQREVLMETIKKSQVAIEAIRKDMMSQASPPAAKVLQHRKSKEEAQKEVLDAELDLITKQAEGGDTSELQKKVLELKARVSSLSARSHAGPVRGAVRKRFHPTRGLLSKNNHLLPDAAGTKKKVFQKHAVDHRPTRLLVSGYEGDEQQSVLAHFAQYGEISDYVTDDATPSVVLNFKTRKEAELAILKGKNFQDRTLSVTWCNNAQLSTQMSSRSSNRTVLLSETDDEHLLDGDDELMPELSEEVLLQDDEEEDEESEDRSWRR